MPTVAIVGNGRSRVFAPFTKRIPVWTMNNHAMLWKVTPAAMFEMHPDALTTARYDAEYRTWLKQPHDFPIYMHERQAEIPASVEYPLKEIRRYYGNVMEKGGHVIKDFYTTTPPYMLALALYLGYDRVELYGIDLDKEERQAHRDSVFYWIGYLRGVGVQVFIPEECVLADDALYPINTPPPVKRRQDS